MKESEAKTKARELLKDATWPYGSYTHHERRWMATKALMEAYEKGKKDAKPFQHKHRNCVDLAIAKYWLKKAEYWERKAEAEFARMV